MQQRKRRSSSGSSDSGCFCKRSAESTEETPHRLLQRFSEAPDFSSASISSILADDKLRAAFQTFLNERMMGEILRLQGRLEIYFAADAEKRPEIAKEIYSTYIDPDNADSVDTVTFGRELVNATRARLERELYEDDLFEDVLAEVFVLLTTNGLHDFLKLYAVPTLPECFHNPAQYERFLAFARSTNSHHPVELVYNILVFEQDCRASANAHTTCMTQARRIIESASGICKKGSITNAEICLASGLLDDKTFLECKGDAMLLIMGRLFPAYMRSLRLE